MDAFVQQGNGMNIGDIGATLGSLYLANRQARDARTAQSGINAGVNQQLADMFGPNSAYAQQLRQQLERRDAASGRRSQYGPREVELQAKLAELQARSMPGIMNSMVGQQEAALKAAQQRRMMQAQGLNALYGGARRLGLLDAAERGLQGLFGGSGGGGNMSNADAFSLMGEGGYNSTAPQFNFEPQPGFQYDGGFSNFG